MPLNIHFLNVGHGDCTVVEFPGRLTVIDVNNSKVLDEDTAKELAESMGVDPILLEIYRKFDIPVSELKGFEERLVDPVQFYVRRYGTKPIFRFVATHPDMDHLTGLYCFRSENVGITNFWDTRHSVAKSDKAEEWQKYDIRDWREYQRLRNSGTDPKALFYLRGSQCEFFQQDGVRVWAPFEHQSTLDESGDINSLSYVLCIEYGACRIVLGGDAPISVWERMYKAQEGRYPKVHLLKAPHHGRKTGYHWQSVKAMAPDYTVVSVGKLLKKDDAFASYERYSEKGCYSTRFEGTITAQCWYDGDVWLHDSHGNRLR